MTTRIAMNGFGSMGRLALRAGWSANGIDIVHVNKVRMIELGQKVAASLP